MSCNKRSLTSGYFFNLVGRDEVVSLRFQALPLASTKMTASWDIVVVWYKLTDVIEVRTASKIRAMGASMQ